MNTENYLNYTFITTYNPEDCHMDQIYRQTDRPTNQPTNSTEDMPPSEANSSSARQANPIF